MNHRTLNFHIQDGTGRGPTTLLLTAVKCAEVATGGCAGLPVEVPVNVGKIHRLESPGAAQLILGRLI